METRDFKGNSRQSETSRDFLTLLRTGCDLNRRPPRLHTLGQGRKTHCFWNFPCTVFAPQLAAGNQLLPSVFHCLALAPFLHSFHCRWAVGRFWAIVNSIAMNSFFLNHHRLMQKPRTLMNCRLCLCIFNSTGYSKLFSNEVGLTGFSPAAPF